MTDATDAPKALARWLRRAQSMNSLCDIVGSIGAGVCVCVCGVPESGVALAAAVADDVSD